MHVCMCVSMCVLCTCKRKKGHTSTHTHTDKQTLNEPLNLPRRILKHPGEKRVIREVRWWRTKELFKKKEKEKEELKRKTDKETWRWLFESLSQF